MAEHEKLAELTEKWSRTGRNVKIAQERAKREEIARAARARSWTLWGPKWSSLWRWCLRQPRHHPENSNPLQDLGIILRPKSDLCDSGQSLKDGITSARGWDANTTQHRATCMWNLMRDEQVLPTLGSIAITRADILVCTGVAGPASAPTYRNNSASLSPQTLFLCTAARKRLPNVSNLFLAATW